MLKSLIFVGLSILSSQTFSADKQITCPFLEPADNSGTEGLLEGGAWRIDTFIFNTDDFSREGDRYASFNRTLHYYNPTWKEGDRVKKMEWSKLVSYTTTPDSIFFHTVGVPSVRKSHEISRTDLRLISETTLIQCSISDLQIERAF